MKVKDIMTSPVILLTLDMSFLETAKVFSENKITAAPVVDTNGHVVGVVSEKDLFRAFFPSYKDLYKHPEQFMDSTSLEDNAASAKDKKVADIMTTNPITTAPNAPVLKIGGLMVASGTHRVPVIDDGKVVGIISRGDIYRSMLKHYMGMESAHPATLHR